MLSKEDELKAKGEDFSIRGAVDGAGGFIDSNVEGLAKFFVSVLAHE